MHVEKEGELEFAEGAVMMDMFAGRGLDFVVDCGMRVRLSCLFRLSCFWGLRLPGSVVPTVHMTVVPAAQVRMYSLTPAASLRPSYGRGKDTKTFAVLCGTWGGRLTGKCPCRFLKDRQS